MRRLLLLAITLLLATVPLLGQSITAAPAVATVGGGNVTFSLTCTCTDWTTGTPGLPAFSLIALPPSGITGPSIVSQSVTSSSTATIVVSPGNFQGLVAIKAPAASGFESPSLAMFNVQPAFSASKPFIVNGSTGVILTLTGIGASWTTGTPGSPAFTLSGCPTASIASQQVTNSTTANLTLNAGATDCTATVTDPSTSNTTTFKVHTPQTFYVDSVKGGTRYSADNTSGQCNGLSDTAYSSGVNQSCPFNDVAYMWETGAQTSSLGSHYGWLMQGGDTLKIMGTLSDGITYRLGWHSSSGCGPDGNGVYWGLCGDAQDSGMLPPPSGVAEDHTVIEGGNAGACTAKTARTQLHGGYGLDYVIRMGVNLRYAPYSVVEPSDFVDLKCLDITDFSPDDSGDFALNGVGMSYAVHDATFTDIRAHGLKGAGFLGETGGNVVATDVAFDGNFSSGWNTDRGIGVTGFGSLSLTNFEIIGNGCAEEYPIVDAMPYTLCRDQNDGGYGDGFGTTTVNSPAPGWQVSFDQGVVAYNTQDGLDTLHLSGIGSSTKITRTLLYGNMGNQIKIGGSGATVRNNVIVGNCGAMGGTIPGFPSGYNTAMIGQGGFCRAGNTAVVMEIQPGDTDYYQNNTLFSAGYVGVEMEPYNYVFHTVLTGTEHMHYDNNIFYGFYNTDHTENSNEIYNDSQTSDNPNWPGSGPTQYSPLTNAGGSWSNNASFGSALGCPRAGGTGYICGDPGLVDETNHLYGYGNVAPATNTSAVVGAGVTISGITTDFNGTTRLSPPAIGAYEFNPPPTPTYMQGCVNSSSTASVTCTPSGAASAGDLLVIATKTAANSTAALTVTTTAGPSCTWSTLPVIESAGTFSATIGYCVVGSAGTPTIQATWTGGGGTFTDISVGDYAPGTAWASSPLDVYVSSNNGSSGTCTTGTTSSTANAQELVVGACFNFNIAQTWGSATGYTQRSASSRNTTGWWDLVTSTAGTQSLTTTISTDSSVGYVAAFKQSSQSPSLSTITVTPNPGSAVVGGTATFAASCLYSDGSTSPCTITWTDTAAHSSVGSTTGVVTGVSAGTDTITATMSSVSGTATVTIALPSPTYQGSFLIQGPIN